MWYQKYMQALMKNIISRLIFVSKLPSRQVVYMGQNISMAKTRGGGLAPVPIPLLHYKIYPYSNLSFLAW